jgi:hypothetical protein
MTIELNDYGLMIDLGDFLYVSLSWAMVITTTLLLVGYKAYKIYLKRNGLVGWNY